MTETASPLGLLLDVDGPIASPVTRTIATPSIIADLVTLAAADVPIAFITGRSATFIREQVVGPLLAAGLPEGVRMYGVCEKGAVWFPITSRGMGEIVVDDTVALPDGIVDEVRTLVADRFADTMFFDETKLAMISVEQRTDVDHAAFVVEQPAFNEAVFAMLVAHGLGVRFGRHEVADAAGLIPFRIDPTIISTDVESVKLDKDHGAERALAFFAESGPLPTVWRSVGDSRSDYLMADHLHSAGYDVAHVDVRPADGVLKRPYPVIIIGEEIHDEAGATFLDYWVEKLGLSRSV
jgi:catechol 2,3-dioxygenase-like lactoylglutathione lyase family enzyme